MITPQASIWATAGFAGAGLSCSAPSRRFAGLGHSASIPVALPAPPSPQDFHLACEVVTKGVRGCTLPERRELRRMPLGKFFAIGVGVLCLAAPVRDQIVFNPSPSIPRGWYIRAGGEPTMGALVTVRARDVALGYAASRNFTRPEDRFIKRVAASLGETVCAQGDNVVVGRRHLVRLAHDRTGRALPRWNGCVTLRANEFFLLGDTTDSFDSRYFGVVSAQEIEGVWRPL